MSDSSNNFSSNFSNNFEQPSLDFSPPPPASAKRVPLPNVGDLLFIGICQLLLFMRPSFIFSDGSTGWHLVTGMTILASGVIPHSDIMSYTFAGKAWVAYEWLSDLIMALLVKAGGLNLLAIAVTTAIAALILAIYQGMRVNGCRFYAALGLCIVGLLASANHWLVRPHIFTFWGVYLFVTRLEDYYQGKISFKRLALWLLPYMVLWVNCHPAFLLGFVITSVYLAATTVKTIGAVMSNSAERSKYMRLSLTLCGLLTGLLVVSLINPYGLQLYTYISEYLHGTSILSHTDEFKSPNFHFNLHAICLEFLFLLLAAGFVINGRKVSLPSFLLTVMFGHLSLWAVRNIPLFAFVTMPLLGRLYSPRPEENVGTGKLAKIISDFDAQEKLSDMHILPIAYVLILAAVAVFGGRGEANPLLHSGFDAESQPIKTLAYIKDNKLEAREGLSLDNWGGILRYQLDMPVFIDDRADFYGEKFYNEYGTICEVRPGYEVLLDKHKINWVLFPRESTLVQTLKTRADWKVVSEDQASTLLVRTAPTR